MKNWGPLWAHSAFDFEAGNHELLQAIQCSRGVIFQIIRFININCSVSILENHIFGQALEVAKKYCKNILTTKVKKNIKISSARYFCKVDAIETRLKN